MPIFLPSIYVLPLYEIGTSIILIPILDIFEVTSGQKAKSDSFNLIFLKTLVRNTL